MPRKKSLYGVKVVSGGRLKDIDLTKLLPEEHEDVDSTPAVDLNDFFQPWTTKTMK